MRSRQYLSTVGRKWCQCGDCTPQRACARWNWSACCLTTSTGKASRLRFGRRSPRASGRAGCCWTMRCSRCWSSCTAKPRAGRKDGTASTCSSTTLADRTGNNLLRKFYGTCKRAGIADGKRNGSVDLHSLRVTFTTLSLEGGASPKAVQTILGHATLDMTMRVYAKATDRSMRDAINALPFATATAPDHVLTHRGYGAGFVTGFPQLSRTRIGQGGMTLQTAVYQRLTTEPGGTRTHDLRIKSPLLYQLSYELEIPMIQERIMYFELLNITIRDTRICTPTQIRCHFRNKSHPRSVAVAGCPTPQKRNHRTCRG